MQDNAQVFNKGRTSLSADKADFTSGKVQEFVSGKLRFGELPEEFRFREPPQEKQREFLRAGEKFVAYGGARGGGKSWALRRKCMLLGWRYPGIGILMLRRRLADLRENHIIKFQMDFGGVLSYKSDERAMWFPNGSRIRFGYLDSDADLLQYQGQDYDVICMDEATQFSEEEFLALGACLRGHPGYPKRFYLTCNPGGIGHGWVKRLFIDRNDYRGSENPADYRFVRALATDNRFNGEGYLHMLELLPEKTRRAWLYGDWDSYAGQFFTEFDPAVHVAEPFQIPSGWRRFFAEDYGLDMLAGYWIAVSFDGSAYVYREIYESNRIVSDAARLIREREGPDRPDVRIAPPDLWSRSKDTGKSIIEGFADGGLYFTKADNSRAAGWMAVHEWLKPFVGADGKKTARLKIFKTCPNLIRTLPLLQYDIKNGSDTLNEPHEITPAPDALRYWAISRPCAAELVTAAEGRAFCLAAETGPKTKPAGVWGGEVDGEYLMGGW